MRNFNKNIRLVSTITIKNPIIEKQSLNIHLGGMTVFSDLNQPQSLLQGLFIPAGAVEWIEALLYAAEPSPGALQRLLKVLLLLQAELTHAQSLPRRLEKRLMLQLQLRRRSKLRPTAVTPLTQRLSFLAQTLKRVPAGYEIGKLFVF